MSGSSKKNISVYGAQAGLLAKVYNAVATPDAVPDFAAVLLQMPDRDKLWALDLGCGSGRDAAWMADQGFNVVAVDGAPEMLAELKKSNARPNIQILQDAAPEIAELKKLGRKFDVFLMNAFLFHMNEKEREIMYENLKEVSNAGAYVYVTLRHGPVPQGRAMFSVPVEELAGFAKRSSFVFKDLGRRDDPLGRKDVSWDHIALRFGTPNRLF